MKVLILAGDCNPKWPSLPQMLWKQLVPLSNLVDLTIATHVRNQDNIKKTGIGKATVHYFNNEYIAAPMHKFSSWLRGDSQLGQTTGTAFAYLPYLFFEWEVWKGFTQDLKNKKFDLIHRISPVSPVIPSPMAKWSPVPFIWGPINGGLPWPEEFSKERRKEKEWITYARALYKLLPYTQSAYKYSQTILTAFPHVKDDIPKSCQEKIVQFPEIGVDHTLFQKKKNYWSGQGPIKLITVGRLVPYKCFDVLIQSLQKIKEIQPFELTLVGDGPEKNYLESLIKQLDLSEQIKITGWVDNSEVAKLMQQSDLFLFSSIREFGGGVVVEAMAAGLPSIVVDYGGPGEVIEDQVTGIKIPLANKNQLIKGFSEKILWFTKQPQKIKEMGKAAQLEVIRNYSWEEKAKKIKDLYQKIQ